MTHAVISAAEAFEIHQQVVSLARTIEGAFLALGELLARVKEERLFLTLGHDSFEAYLGDPEIGLSHAQAYRILRVRELRCATGGTTPLLSDADVMEMGIAKADMVRPSLLAARDEDERRELVEKAKALSKTDLHRELLAGRGADADAAWRETSGFYVRRVRALLSRIDDAPDQQAAMELWDEIGGVAMAAVARLKGGAA